MSGPLSRPFDIGIAIPMVHFMPSQKKPLQKATLCDLSVARPATSENKNVDGSPPPFA
jgi:hypothetical protein